MFDPPRSAAPARDDEEVRVRLHSVQLERLRDFGDVWLAWGLWRMLELGDLLDREIQSGREDVPWSTVAAILTIARFCEPSSELHIEEKWYRRTALEELLDVAPEQVHTDRLYEGLDRLLPHKEALETHLRRRFGELFELKCDLLLYDITSTYFEGDMEGCPLSPARLLARFTARSSPGLHRARRHRGRLSTGLRSLLRKYARFDDRAGDDRSVGEEIRCAESGLGDGSRDGQRSELEIPPRAQAKYIVGTPKQMLRHFEQHLTDQDWSQAQEGVEVKLVPGPDGDETFLLARSADRRAKELAMHEKFVVRLEAGLQKLQAAAASGRLKDEATAGERLGRLKEKNWRASHMFDVTIKKLDTPRGKRELEVTFRRNAKFGDWAQLADGCYLLRSNLVDIDAATLWKRYIQLTEAEWAFRITKDELAIRPIWHHKEERVKAHILVCFLAYAMWKTLAGWMRGAGLGDAPRTLLYELAKIKSGDIVLPARTRDGVSKKIRLRHVTEPDESQAVLLHRLGLQLPRRLRRFDELVIQM